MSWIEILGAIGFGSFITTVLNIFWLPKIMEKIEKRKWLRDKQYKAFSKLSKELLSFRLYKKGVLKKDKYSPFEFFAIASEAIFLIEDKKLINRIKNFILELGHIFEKIKNGKILDKKDEFFLQMAGEIVSELHTVLMGNRQKYWVKRPFKR
ncbi:hypothetical protein ES702_07101 [subsurface metagenome]